MSERKPLFGRAVLVSADMLEGPRCERSGRPLAEKPDPTMLPWAVKALTERNAERFEKWTSLSVQVRSQIVSQLKFKKGPNDQLFRVRLETKDYKTGKSIDSLWPELLIFSPDIPNAVERYRSLCGITAIGPSVSIVAEPCSEEEARAE